LGGLTMSEEGGLEEVDESLRAAASGRCNGCDRAGARNYAAFEAFCFGAVP
jgi:hypothetical protein